MTMPPPPPSSAEDEAAFIAALRAGDEAAYEKLVRTQTGPLLAVARRYVRDDEEARDVVQNAFIAAFRSLDRFEGKSKVSTWLHRITVNHALMRVRARGRRPEDPIDVLLPRFLDDGHQSEPSLPWPGEGADVLLLREETRARVREAIDRLPETYRTILLLRDIDGLSGDEAAAELGITTTAVKVRLHRARMALRALLDETVRTATRTTP